MSVIVELGPARLETSDVESKQRKLISLLREMGRHFALRFRRVPVSPSNYRIAFPFAFPFLPAKSDILRFRVRHRRSVSL